MNIRSRLGKLEAAAGAMNKPLFDMTDAQLERFMRKHLGLPDGTPITDDMLLDVVLSGKVVASKYPHEEALQMMFEGATA